MLDFLTITKKVITSHNVGVMRCINLDKGICTVSNSLLSYITINEDLCDVQANVDYGKFSSAYLACTEPSIRTTAKYLMIEQGSFKARLALVEEPYPINRIKGEQVQLNTEQITNLKRIVPFISTDSSRQWACSVLFDGTHAYATNNVVAVRVPVATRRKFALPGATLVELLRVTSAITSVAMADNAVRFNFENGLSLQSQLIANEWPDISNVIDGAVCNAPPLPAGVANGVEKLGALCSNMLLPRIHLTERGIYTDEGESYAEDTGIVFPSVPNTMFHSVPLLQILKVATHCDISTYPRPCYFRGDNIEGVIMGLR